jgi:hypothetical protein
MGAASTPIGWSGIRSIGIISIGFEVIHAFGAFEDVGAGFEGVHQAYDGALCDFAQEGFELRVGFSDGVHVRTVGRQIATVSKCSARLAANVAISGEPRIEPGIFAIT